MSQHAVVPRLESRYRRPDRWILYGRARLFQDHLAFFEIRWTGTHRFTIPLQDVTEVQWWSSDDTNLQIDARGRSSLRLHIDGAGLWKYEIDSLRGEQLETPGDLPSSISSAAA